ncbi:MAG: hypothetical protein QOD50_1717 [Actinomycetota bacterium]|nr:hypothetical protein [Actinomycetota bacterium]
MKPTNRVKLRSTIAVVAATVAVLGSGVLAAEAATRSPVRPRSLAVSVPSEPAELAAGATGTVPIRVVNPGTRRVTVTVTGRRVRFGDDGRVTISGRDPIWGNRVDFPAAQIVIAANSYRDLGLTVHMPEHLRPDLYFIGFLVTPVRGGAGNVAYVNQIGSYLTIDVPGPRTRLLTADLNLPSFALTSKLHAKLHIHNAGDAAATWWGENATAARPGSSAPRQARFDRSLLPARRSRTIVVDAQPAFLVAIVTMHVHIFYPGRTDAATAEIVLTKRVFVVQPAALVLLGAILFAALIWYARRRRMRRQHRGDHQNSRDRGHRGRKRRSRARRQRVPARADTATRLDRRLAQARANPKAHARAHPKPSAD